MEQTTCVIHSPDTNISFVICHTRWNSSTRSSWRTVASTSGSPWWRRRCEWVSPASWQCPCRKPLSSACPTSTRSVTWSGWTSTRPSSWYWLPRSSGPRVWTRPSSTRSRARARHQMAPHLCSRSCRSLRRRSMCLPIQCFMSSHLFDVGNWSIWWVFCTLMYIPLWFVCVYLFIKEICLVPLTRTHQEQYDVLNHVFKGNWIGLSTWHSA